MRKITAAILTLIICASGAMAAAINQAVLTGTPDVFCQVSKEPDPALLGHWGCTHKRYAEKEGKYVMEPVEYVLVKVGDKYGLYFYRVKAENGKKYSGWRKWYIKGSEINSGYEPKIFTKDGEVYFRWKTDTPTKMTRIQQGE